MHKRWSVVATAGLVLIGAIAVSARPSTTSSTMTTQVPAPRPGSWTIPPTAAEEKNPFAGDPAAVDAGKALYGKNCQRCHGPGGKGDGPDGDPDSMQDMDLTQARRGPRNPDGVVFYKIWNGRAEPKMPAFSEELSREQAWAVVAYVQTLRAK